MNKIQTLRKQTGLSQSKFASYFGIPTHTLQVWEQEVRTPPDYVISMMERILLLEGFCPVEKSVRSNL